MTRRKRDDIEIVPLSTGESMRVFCTNPTCEHVYKGQRPCPMCKCPHWSRSDRVSVEKLVQQFSGVPKWSLTRLSARYTLPVLERIGIPDLEAEGMAALVR